MYTKGDRRKKNRQYDTLLSQGYRLRKRGQYQEAAKARKAAQKLPSVDLNDPDYRRLRFVRYADDWLLGLIGTKEEAEQIKAQIKTYLHEELKLELSDEKTLITHARTEAARFLSYEVTVMQEDKKRSTTKNGTERRSINGVIGLRVPSDVIEAKCQCYMRNTKAIQRPELIQESDYTILLTYQLEFQGIANYYRLAYNMTQLSKLNWVMKT